MEQQTHKRRVHYSGTHPKNYDEKYKELDPERYRDTVEKVISKLSCPLLSGYRMFLAIAHNIGMKHLQLDPKLLAKLFTKMLISVAFLPAEVVIDMTSAYIIAQLI